MRCSMKMRCNGETYGSSFDDDLISGRAAVFLCRPIFFRSASVPSPEIPDVGAGGGETGFGRNLRDGKLCIFQKSLAHMQPVFYEILIRRFSHISVKTTETFCFADVGGSGDGFYGKIFPVMAVQISEKLPDAKMLSGWRRRSRRKRRQSGNKRQPQRDERRTQQVFVMWFRFL